MKKTLLKFTMIPFFLIGLLIGIKNINDGSKLIGPALIYMNIVYHAKSWEAINNVGHT